MCDRCVTHVYLFFEPLHLMCFRSEAVVCDRCVTHGYLFFDRCI